MSYDPNNAFADNFPILLQLTAQHQRANNFVERARVREELDKVERKVKRAREHHMFSVALATRDANAARHALARA